MKVYNVLWDVVMFVIGTGWGFTTLRFVRTWDWSWFFASVLFASLFALRGYLRKKNQDK